MGSQQVVSGIRFEDFLEHNVFFWSRGKVKSIGQFMITLDLFLLGAAMAQAPSRLKSSKIAARKFD